MNGGLLTNKQQDIPELISIILRLSAVQGGRMHGTRRVMLAEVLRHVAQRNPQLADRLHDQ